MLIAGTVEFVLSIVGVAAGVVAILVGFVGIRSGLAGSKKQLETVNSVNEEIQKILAELRGELQTRYIGRFPDFIPSIVNVIRGATRELTIFCDLPAYGVVSNPPWYVQYRDAIQDKMQDHAVKVRILHLDAPARRAALEAQFGELWRSNMKAKAFLERFGEDVQSIAKDTFLDLIESEQSKALEAFQMVSAGRDIKVTEIHAIMPMYFWIADRNRAVFALTQFDRAAHEVAFLTTSENLIKAMGGIYKRYLAEAQDAGKPAHPGVSRRPAAELLAAGSAAGDGEAVKQREQQPPGAEHA